MSKDDIIVVSDLNTWLFRNQTMSVYVDCLFVFSFLHHFMSGAYGFGYEGKNLFIFTLIYVDVLKEAKAQWLRRDA